MLNSLFTKTIYEKRWSLITWSMTMFLFTLLIVWLFPTFRDSFGQALQNVPDSLKSILGQASDYQNINGFLELQVFMQMIFLTFIYGIILLSGLIAGEESDGTLQSLMAQPISRTKAYFQKLAAGMVMIWIVSLAMFLAVWVGSLIINEPVNLWRVLQATFAQFLVALVLSLVAFLLGASTGKRGIAGALAGIYAFLSYLVYGLSNTAKFLKIPNYFSPFKYLSNPRVLDNGLKLSNVTILACACLVMILLGWFWFSKRDIFQR